MRTCTAPFVMTSTSHRLKSFRTTVSSKAKSCNQNVELFKCGESTSLGITVYLFKHANIEFTCMLVGALQVLSSSPRGKCLAALGCPYPMLATPSNKSTP